MREFYALAATLNSYEVEELDAFEFVRLLRTESVDNDVLEGFLSQFDHESFPEAA